MHEHGTYGYADMRRDTGHVISELADELRSAGLTSLSVSDLEDIAKLIGSDHYELSEAIRIVKILQVR